MPARSPAEFGLLKIFANAGTCEVSRPIMPALSWGESAAAASREKPRRKPVSVLKAQTYRPVKRVRWFMRCIAVKQTHGSGLLAQTESQFTQSPMPFMSCIGSMNLEQVERCRPEEQGAALPLKATG